MKEKKKNNKCDVPVGHQPAFYFFTRFMCSFFLGSTQVGRFIVKFVVILGALNRSTFFLELHVLALCTLFHLLRARTYYCMHLYTFVSYYRYIYMIIAVITFTCLLLCKNSLFFFFLIYNPV